MLKKVYKPSWLAGLCYGMILERYGYGCSKRMIAWWGFLNKHFNNKRLQIGEIEGYPVFKIQYPNQDYYTAFDVESKVWHCPAQFLNGGIFKEKDGAIYEITYDTPIG